MRSDLGGQSASLAPVGSDGHATRRACSAGGRFSKPDQIGDEEECLLRDHLLAVHPRTVQSETLSVLLRLFVVTEQPPPAA